jgi:hypothetical protein
MNSSRCRRIARALTVLWAGWWTYFALAVGFSEASRPWQLGPYPLAATGLFLGSALIAWRFEAVGRWLLLLEALAVLIGYPLMSAGQFSPATVAFMLATLALPPLLAAILLFRGERQTKTA